MSQAQQAARTEETGNEVKDPGEAEGQSQSPGASACSGQDGGRAPSSGAWAEFLPCPRALSLL